MEVNIWSRQTFSFIILNFLKTVSKKCYLVHSYWSHILKTVTMSDRYLLKISNLSIILQRRMWINTQDEDKNKGTRWRQNNKDTWWRKNNKDIRWIENNKDTRWRQNNKDKMTSLKCFYSKLVQWFSAFNVDFEQLFAYFWDFCLFDYCWGLLFLRDI